MAFSPICGAAQETLRYLYSPTLDEKQQLLYDRIVVHARNAEFDNALELSEALLELSEKSISEEPVVYGKLKINHGIIQSASKLYDLALISIEDGLEIMETRKNPFSTDITKAMMAKGITEYTLQLTEDAEDSFRRAQHVMHRNQGVYAAKQLDVINWITRTHLKSERSESADREQKFSLRVAEKAYGPDSLKMIPHLSRLGAYFANRGSTIPPMLHSTERLKRDLLFKSAIDMYERAVIIIEDNYGENDARLVDPLRGLAKARMLQFTNRRYAEAPLIRSLSIVESNPNADIGDRARAMVDLGDLYTILADDKAEEVYKNAWDMLQGDEQSRMVADRLFGAPTRLYPRSDGVLYLDRQPDVGRGSPLFVTLEYTVNSNGKVGPIKVTGKNVPNEQVRLLRQRIKHTKFRPRIDDGELVDTPGLTYYQPYQVYKRQIRDESDDPGEELTAETDEESEALIEVSEKDI